jgi:hypothetical protein
MIDAWQPSRRAWWLGFITLLIASCAAYAVGHTLTGMVLFLAGGVVWIVIRLRPPG